MTLCRDLDKRVDKRAIQINNYVYCVIKIPYTFLLQMKIYCCYETNNELCVHLGMFKVIQPNIPQRQLKQTLFNKLKQCYRIVNFHI